MHTTYTLPVSLQGYRPYLTLGTSQFRTKVPASYSSWYPPRTAVTRFSIHTSRPCLRLHSCTYGVGKGVPFEAPRAPSCMTLAMLLVLACSDLAGYCTVA